MSPNNLYQTFYIYWSTIIIYYLKKKNNNYPNNYIVPSETTKFDHRSFPEWKISIIKESEIDILPVRTPCSFSPSHLGNFPYHAFPFPSPFLPSWLPFSLSHPLRKPKHGNSRVCSLVRLRGVWHLLRLPTRPWRYMYEGCVCVLARTFSLIIFHDVEKKDGNLIFCRELSLW